MAYLRLPKLLVRDIPAQRPWSAFALQRAFAWEIMQAKVGLSAREMARKWLHMGNAA